MTSNQIKWIACLCMLIDHIGFLFFPQVEVLRWIGRLALPLFAYFIGEGCYYTSRPVWYFLRIFILGIVCQLFYTGQQLLSGNVTEIYLNILFTFSLSIPVCLTYLRLRESFEEYYPSVAFVYGCREEDRCQDRVGLRSARCVFAAVCRSAPQPEAQACSVRYRCCAFCTFWLF